MKIWIAAILLFFVCVSTCLCQEWTLLESINMQGINKVDVDAREAIYVTLDGGEVRKRPSGAADWIVFSPLKNGEIFSVETSQQFKLLLFYQNFQEALILNRFLGDPARYDLEDFPIGYATNVAYNFQRNLWVVDQTDFSLKLCDMLTKELLLQQTLYQFNDSGYQDFVFMKEYQGRLYLADDSNGMLVFDNFGNLIKEHPAQGILDLSFDQDKALCLLADRILILSLYSEVSEMIELPETGIKAMRNIGDSFYFVDSDGLKIYNYLRKN